MSSYAERKALLERAAQYKKEKEVKKTGTATVLEDKQPKQPSVRREQEKQEEGFPFAQAEGKPSASSPAFLEAFTPARGQSVSKEEGSSKKPPVGSSNAPAIDLFGRNKDTAKQSATERQLPREEESLSDIDPERLLEVLTAFGKIVFDPDKSEEALKQADAALASLEASINEAKKVRSNSRFKDATRLELSRSRHTRHAVWDFSEDTDGKDSEDSDDY